MSAWTCAACGSYNGGGTACLQCGAAPGSGAPATPAGGDAPAYDPAGQGPAGYGAPSYEPQPYRSYDPPPTRPAYDPATYGAEATYGAQATYEPQPYEPARWSALAPPERQRPGHGAVPAPVAGRRNRWVVPVALLLVLAAAGGGSAAYAFVLRPDPTAQTEVKTPPVDTPTTVTTTSTPRPTPTRTPSTTPTAVGAVTIDPTVTDTRAAEIATVLNEYFTGINTRDYDRALAVYDPAGVVDPADPRKVAHFTAGVSTTTDTDVVLHQVGPSQTGVGVVQARVTFNSHQEPGYGPAARPNETCTAWDVMYTLTRPAGSYLIYGSKGTSTPC